MTVQYDATHSCGIHVGFDEDCEFTLEACVENLATFMTVYTGNARVSDIFGIPKSSEDVAKAAYLKAIKVGNPVFFIEYGNHSIESIRIHQTKPRSDWDSGCVGFVVCDRQKWQEQTHKIPLPTLIFREVKEWFEDIDNAITGCLFQWTTVDQHGSDSGCRCGGFRSEEEALQDALENFPECMYDESRFEVTRTYRLAF